MDELDEFNAEEPPVWAIFGDLMSGLVGVFVLLLVWVLGFQLELANSLEEEVEKRQAEELSTLRNKADKIKRRQSKGAEAPLGTAARIRDHEAQLERTERDRDLARSERDELTDDLARLEARLHKRPARFVHLGGQIFVGHTEFFEQLCVELRLVRPERNVFSVARLVGVVEMGS